MPRRTDIHTILIIGSGPIVIGQGCEFDYSGVQACRALREEGYRVVLINSNPATIMTDPQFADATYIEPITPEAVEKILQREKDAGTPVDALLPTLGGQTGLNTGMACFDSGLLTRFGVQMIGADREAIHRGEDRQRFKELMAEIGLKTPLSRVVHNIEDARDALEIVNLPAIIRPAFTLGGTGGGIAYNREEFEEIVARGLDASPVTEVLIEQSVIGWKEYEMEVVRDRNDNCIIICSIENIDAMGVHTGDSITVAPIQTLTDKEYQKMRDASFAVIRAVGVETGGSNIQFGIDPKNGDMVVIEMNPRVSRSSALASKATGYPIAKIAAKLAVGYTLDELPNPITTRKRSAEARSGPQSAIADGALSKVGGALSKADGALSKADGALLKADDKLAQTDHETSAPDGSSRDVREDYELYTSACFEPSIDYVVIKIPRWTFEKFPDADETLTTQMKSVGEAMAIGRTFKEALQKGIRSMEVKRYGFGLDKNDKWLNAENARNTGVPPVPERSEAAASEHGRDARATSNWPIPEETLRRKLAVPSQGRLYYVRYALKMGWTVEQIYGLTHIDPWFLAQMKELVDFEATISDAVKPLTTELNGFAAGDKGRGQRKVSDMLRSAKSLGYSDVQIAAAASAVGVRLQEVDLATFEKKGSKDLPPPTADQIRRRRETYGLKPVYKLVDTCAAEFEAATPYYYSTYETPFTVVDPRRVGFIPTAEVGGDEPHPTQTTAEDEIRLTDRPKIIIIGGGPNRIGQGIEFDYCCVQAAFALRDLGIESVMINSNPETVSTDYDTSDLLFFEPLTHEDVLNVCERLNGQPFDDSPEIDFVDGSTPVHEAHVRLIRNYLRGHGIDRVAVFSVTHAQPHEIVNDLNVPATSYNFADDRGDRWSIYFEDREPNVLWGCSTGTNPGISAEAEETIKKRFKGQLKPSRPGLVKGVVVQYGGQTPLNLAQGLFDAGVPLLGTPMDSLDKAGSRERFRELVEDLELKQPPNGIAKSVDDARRIASEIGYPVMVRPSFVLGGRAMEIVSDEAQLNYYMANAIDVSTVADAPILIDKFLDHAVECDVDCIADFEPRRIWPQLPIGTAAERELYLHRDMGTAGPDGSRRQAIVIGVMEHIEEAGIHSGDSACTLPPYTLSPEIVAELKRQTKELARALHVKGLMNVQYAIKDGEIYLIEVNPRASRTVPFVGKATGIPWALHAAKVMAGATLDELGIVEQPDPKHVSVKEVVFPFSKFPGVDVILGPEMRSTGEVMGIDDDFAGAYAKAQMAAGAALPLKGTVFISVNDRDKSEIADVAKLYAEAGFKILSTGGTFDVLSQAGVACERINKLAEGRPNIRDVIKNGQLQLIINTPTKKGPATDEGKIRAMSVMNKVPIVTTVTAARAAGKAILKLQKTGWTVKPLQAYHAH